MALSILINGTTYLDLQKEYVGLTYQVFDISALESRQGTFSNDFIVPNTAHNREALGFATEQNVYESEFSSNNRIPAKVFQNNILISNGFIEIVETTKNNIEISFYGETVPVFELIKDKKLDEIDLSHLTHAYTAANVISSFSNTEGYIYLPIDYGLFTDRATLEIEDREIFPAIYISEITKQIFRSIGYKLDGTLLNRSLYKKSVIPFAESDTGLLPDDFVNEKNFYVTNGPLPYPSFSPGVETKYNFGTKKNNFGGTTYDNDLFNLTTDRYTADDNYEMTATFAYDIRAFRSLNGAVSLPTIIIKKNGVQIASTSTVTNIQVTETMGDGDYLEAYVVNNHSGSVQFPSAFFGAVNASVLIAGSSFFLKVVLPDVLQTDFLKWLLFRFCAVMEVDNFTKTVHLNQFNDLKNNSIDDWSSKIDLKRDVVTKYNDLVSNYGKSNIAKYAIDDSDTYQTNYNSINTNPFGSGVFELDNDFIEGEKTIFETPFSGTFLIESFSTNKIILPYIPRHLEGETEQNVPAPRVLTVYGTVDISQISQATTLNIMGTNVTEVPFAYFYKSTFGFGADDFKESLAFGVQNIFAPNDFGAFETDYLEIIRILNNPEIKRAYLKLNQVDISNLSHLKEKYIEKFGGYFYLNLIDEYDGSGDSVLCELIKI